MAEALPPNPGEMRFGKLDDVKARVAAAIDASRKYLFSQQHPEEGYWCGELGADTTLESDYILLHRLLARRILSGPRSAPTRYCRTRTPMAAGRYLPVVRQTSVLR